MARAKAQEPDIKRPGRPKVTETPHIPGQVSTSLFDNEYASLKTLGKDKGLSFATLMRIICGNYLADFSGVKVAEGIVRYARGPEFEARPQKLLRVSFILTPEQKTGLEQLATKKKVSESAILRSLIKHFLAGSDRVFTITL